MSPWQDTVQLWGWVLKCEHKISPSKTILSEKGLLTLKCTKNRKFRTANIHNALCLIPIYAHYVHCESAPHKDLLKITALNKTWFQSEMESLSSSSWVNNFSTFSIVVKNLSFKFSNIQFYTKLMKGYCFPAFQVSIKLQNSLPFKHSECTEANSKGRRGILRLALNPMPRLPSCIQTFWSILFKFKFLNLEDTDLRNVHEYYV